jgi:indolepyruvate ferredoxin oxidoreductase
MDMAGMAQKGGTVYSYVQIAAHDEEISATKVAAGRCDVLIGADAVVAGSGATLSRLHAQGLAVVNEDGSPTSEFIKSRDWTTPVGDLLARLRGRLKDGRVLAMPAARIATQAFGDSIFANLILLGVAWQAGRVPIVRNTFEEAIRLNGTAVSKNLEAFRLGCHLAVDPHLASRLLAPRQDLAQPQTLEELIKDRIDRLAAYWNAAYGQKYKDLATLAAVRLPEDLAVVLATQLYRVMAYKDEYEVARLLTSDSFRKSIETEFGTGVRVTYHLAPPAMGSSADIRKRAFGQWMWWPMAALAKMKWLRETPFDIFGRNTERKQERAWRDRYMEFVSQLVKFPGTFDHVVALQIAKIPANVRGFGHVKRQALDAASRRWDELSESLRKK